MSNTTADLVTTAQSGYELPANPQLNMGTVFSDADLERNSFLRERHILTARRLSERPLKLQELTVYCGSSRERVRQVELRAFEKVQQVVVARARAASAPPDGSAAHYLNGSCRA